MNVQSQNPSEQRFIQSQVHTVRPIQTIQPIFVRPPGEQRVIQQVIRSPQGPIEVVNQPVQSQIVTTSLNQGSRVNQQNQPEQIFYSNPSVQTTNTPVQN